jgi:hypothetical protein
MKANPKLLHQLTTRTKCVACKHKLDKPYILPVEKVVPGKFQPNFNTAALFHMKDTHGIAPEIFTDWLAGAIYDQELTIVGNKGFTLHAGF